MYWCPKPSSISFANHQSTLWENLRDEIEDPKDALQGSSEDEINNESGLMPQAENFLLGSSIRDLSALHPPAVQIFRLWQTFLVNVNPLIKMFHAPTVQQTILDASSDLENVPRHTEALMFAIYFLAVTSLRNEDCESMFGEQQQVLLAKYCHAAQQALINSKFLRSLNILTLQALVLFLVRLPFTCSLFSASHLVSTLECCCTDMRLGMPCKYYQASFCVTLRPSYWQS